MKPGSSVASPRSITSAPAGAAALVPATTIFPSVTTTTPGVTSALLFPSNSRAAFSTYVLPAAFCACPCTGSATPKIAYRTSDKLKPHLLRIICFSPCFLQELPEAGNIPPLQNVKQITLPQRDL